MDFKYEYDNNVKEKERIKTMEIEIAGMKLEIPNNLIEERQELMFFDSLEDNLKDLKRIGERFLKCFKSGELNSKDDFQQKLIDHIESGVELYRW